MKHLPLISMIFLTGCSLINKRADFESLEAKYPDLLNNKKSSIVALVKREVSSTHAKPEANFFVEGFEQKKFEDGFLEMLKTFNEKPLSDRLEWIAKTKQHFHILKEETKNNLVGDFLKSNGQAPKALVSSVLDNTFEKDFGFLDRKKYLELVEVMLERKKVSDLDTALKVLSEFNGKEVVTILLRMSDFYRDPNNVGSADKNYYYQFRSKFEKLSLEEKVSFLKEARAQNIVKNNSAQVLLTSIMENEARLLDNPDAKALARGLTVYNFGNATQVGKQFLEFAEGDECTLQVCLDSGEVSLRL